MNEEVKQKLIYDYFHDSFGKDTATAKIELSRLIDEVITFTEKRVRGEKDNEWIDKIDEIIEERAAGEDY